MAYTAIDNSRSVIQHYGKKGMKWRKNRADIEGRELQPLDVANDAERKADWNDQAAIKSYKDTQALNGPADYKIMDRVAQWKARANKVNKMSSLTTKPQI